MTNENHTTGTDRCGEVAQLFPEADVVINIQGDEPLIPVQNVIQVADNLAENNDAAMSTLCEPILDHAEVFNENCVKVVLDKNGYALYFSRAPIPWGRGAFPEHVPENIKCYRHIGLYAYRGEFLRRYSKLEQSPIENWESLEQLRVLWHGEKIHVGIACSETPAGVDTKEDLERVRAFLTKSTH